MELRSLSATSARVYELCPARWQAEFEKRGGSPSGDAANLGTACHHAFLRFVASGRHLKSVSPIDDCNRYFDEKYDELFSDDRRRAEGHKLCAKWVGRQNWANRQVLRLEEKRELTLETAEGPVAFRYIMDREDLLIDDHEIEVIDYKSVSMPLPPEELRNRIQARAYAWAAMKEHPEVERVWVTFDLLRYEPISLAFTRADAEQTEAYLVRLAERIMEDDEPVETPNGECRFCTRKLECSELNRLWAGKTGVIAAMTPVTLLRTRASMEHAKNAANSLLTDLDEEIARLLEAEDEEELVAGDYVATMSSSRRREVNVEALAKLLTPDQLAAMASVGVTSIDDLLRSGELDDETASLVRQTMTWRHGKPSVKVKEL